MVKPDVSQNDRDLVAYAFMSALNDGSRDLMHAVYMPMFKRAISQYSAAKPGGKDTDAKQAFLTMYGLDVPIYTIRRMLQELESELSRREKSQYGLKVFERGKSFTLSQYTFTSEESRYQSVVRNAHALTAAFDEFVKTFTLASSSIPSVSEFITLNRKKLAGFFSREGRSTPLSLDALATFEPHAKFFQMIGDRNQTLFEIAESLFIGSVIAAYLESGFDLSPKFHNGTTFVLDTQFLLRSLDLQQEDETRPAIEVIEMIRHSGGSTVVLDVTLAEIEKNIKTASDHFLDNPLVAEVGNTSIIHACRRRKMTRTALDVVLANISDQIGKVTSARLWKISMAVKSSAEKSTEHEALKKSRFKPANALHDIICIMYVRNARGGAVMSYQKANAWFVSSNPTLYSFNLEHSSSGAIPEVITPEELASLLWLQNPSALNKSVARVGIDELVAQAMSSSLVPMETLADLHTSLKSLTSISPDQYAIVATALATRSVGSLRQLDMLAKADTAAFTNEVLEIIRLQREQQEASSKEGRELSDRASIIESKYREAVAKISAIENGLLLERKRREGSEGHAQALRSERNLLKEELTRQKRTIKWLLLSIAFVMIAWAIITFVDSNVVVNVLTWIAGLGGVWSFGNLIVNLTRSLKK